MDWIIANLKSKEERAAEGALDSFRRTRLQAAHNHRKKAAEEKHSESQASNVYAGVTDFV